MEMIGLSDMLPEVCFLLVYAWDLTPDIWFRLQGHGLDIEVLPVGGATQQAIGVN
ncbi:hypothetical protein PAXRUDRAFT_19273 [Paxillus rubicundulus Ve08.2h10]|uniref:Uncharacterized protein n=1 Tax=Paxillus rubicundulus Ve08.2h10 TaxID=930991 RepID=A0A0D0CVH5_9AGAM|nr:hypothetical protein PAXRUDRAFT_19273 [Paxillus rubicundulus Ve08.2h10]